MIKLKTATNNISVQEDCGAASLAILTYHSLDASGSVVSVSPRAFADQMSCLSDLGFRGVSLREAVDYRTANGGWPAHAVILTFDDGYASVYEHAWPVLRRFGFTATVFVISGYIDGRNEWAAPPHGLGVRPMLSWTQISEMCVSGVEMGAHTRTHADLCALSDADAEAEIIASRNDIEQQLQQTVVSFAYPFGSVSRTALKVAAREFRAACTTTLRRVNGEALESLPRVDMYYIRSLNDLDKLVAGELDQYLALRRWARTARSLFTHYLNG